MAKLFNLARMSTATTGTGAITLGSAISGFLSFADAGVSNADVVTYAISDGSSSEIGRGTYTSSGTTLSRDTILASTNSGSAISLSGTAQVIITGSANDFYERDGRKNYIVNPGMRVSQENGASSGTASGYYPVDQFSVVHSQDGTLTSAQVASATPGGSTHRTRVTVTTADASLSASQYALIYHPIEGRRVADLRFGGSSAKDVVVRFGWKSPAGTYAVCLSNQDDNRTYVREFTISGGDANADTVQTVTFPGDTSGTWDSDNTLSMQLRWTLATGSTFQTTANAWQASEYYGTSSTSNGIGTISNVFELFDVGMYADPDSTGIAPEFELPHNDHDVRECMDYYEKTTSLAAYAATIDINNTVRGIGFTYKSEKRDTASLSVTVSGGSWVTTSSNKENFYGYINIGDTTSTVYVTSWIANSRM